ncbi:MAG: hypothetical protein U0L11_04085 [Acutalibacteraceae bacterium]|nr:hypothetical protein [Acutalibacteraceae bacterium]
MTDKDIIQVLQYIVENGSGACDKCPVFPCGKIKDYEDNQCGRFIAENALDLINRQRAEIERLQKEVGLVSIQFQDMQERQEESQAEIERLKEDRNNYQNLYCLTVEDLDTAKLEAIKEFAEKLKNAWSDNRYDSPDIDFDYFVDLVQEMVGENNGDL